MIPATDERYCLVAIPRTISTDLHTYVFFTITHRIKTSSDLQGLIEKFRKWQRQHNTFHLNVLYFAI